MSFLVQDWLMSVSVNKFAEHVQQMHSERDRQFELEYNVNTNV